MRNTALMLIGRRDELGAPIDFKEEANELAWTANAYLDCAVRLCQSILDEGHEKSIHHNRVPLHLTNLAIELYFKAGLAAAQYNYPSNHELDELRKLYDQVMPDYPLPIPNFIEQLIPKQSENLFADHPIPSSSLQFTRFRYYSDRSGRVFPNLAMADVRQLKIELENLHRSSFVLMMEIWRKCGTEY